jgi:membrane protein
MAALNRAYGTKERRTIFLRRSLSVILIVGFGLALVVLFNLSVFSAQFDRWLASHWALSLELPSLSSLVRHTAGVTGTLVVAATVYRIAPDTPLRWLDVLPGSLLFLVLWTLIAGGFGFYVKFFGYYSVVYGVLWGVIVLLLSAYLVAFFLLLGGELNGTLYRRRQASFLERTDKPDPS